MYGEGREPLNGVCCSVGKMGINALALNIIIEYYTRRRKNLAHYHICTTCLLCKVYTI